MSRKTAREHAFRLLFSTQFQNESVDTMLERYLEANPGVEPEEKDLNFIRTEVVEPFSTSRRSTRRSRELCRTGS